MKKISLGIILIILLLLAAAYIFIPKKIIISSTSSFQANREGVYRFLVNDGNWLKWWPGTVSKNSKDSFLFRYKDYDFQIGKILYTVIQLKLGENNDSSLVLLKVVPFNIDSTVVELSSELNTRSDPFSRIYAYFRAKKIGHVLDDVLSALKNYLGDPKNIYGFNIRKELVQYQDLVSTKQSFSHYPTTGDIYAIIAKLRNYIKKSGANELFSPMLNIKKIDSTNYIAQLGIPVDKELPSKDDISLKRMMKGGNILMGEVTGGQTEIDEATRQMELYISDHQRATIAIPFQMLITDRTREPDSTKWVTRIYYPVV
ncbi:MAG: hypothetical protein ACHQF0_17195 [Chitinophagales bacterium]